MRNRIFKRTVKVPVVVSPTSDFEVTLGVTDSGHDLKFDFGDSWHTAMQGMSRSGKSVLTYVVLSQLAQMPGAVVCGLDPTGVVLGPFRDHPRPNLRATGTANMRAHADALAAILAEMDARLASLHPNRIDKIDAFDSETPLLVVALEEYPSVLATARADDAAQGRKPQERIEPKIKAGVMRLVQEGAKVGIRVILLAQRMDASIVGGPERDQLGNRITLRVNGTDAVRMLHEDGASELAAQAKTFAQGHGVVESPSLPEITRFRGDLITYGEYFDRVEAGAKK